MYIMIQYIIDVLYDPMVLALEEIPMFAQTINNGYLSYSIAQMISATITTAFFFFILYAPIYLVYRVVKRFMP